MVKDQKYITIPASRKPSFSCKEVGYMTFKLGQSWDIGLPVC